MEQSIYIYILKLKGGKYYVGRTKNPHFRLEQHSNGKGCLWTEMYPPIPGQIVNLINGDEFDEDKIVKKWMAQYGIDNVRGGSYVTEILSPECIKFIQKEIRMAKDLCMRCGRNNHFVKNCNAVKDYDGNIIEDQHE